MQLCGTFALLKVITKIEICRKCGFFSYSSKLAPDWCIGEAPNNATLGLVVEDVRVRVRAFVCVCVTQW